MRTDHKEARAYVQKHLIDVEMYAFQLLFVKDSELMVKIHAYLHSADPKGWKQRPPPSAKGMTYSGVLPRKLKKDGELIRTTVVYINEKMHADVATRLRVVVHELGHVALLTAGHINYNPLNEQEPFCYLLGHLAEEYVRWEGATSEKAA